jgi:hypothetical protein
MNSRIRFPKLADDTPRALCYHCFDFFDDGQDPVAVEIKGLWKRVHARCWETMKENGYWQKRQYE